MLEEIVIPPVWQIQVQDFEFNENNLTLIARFVTKGAVCSQCSWYSSQVHSRYLRQPFDLPLVGQPLRLRLEVRRFFCHNPGCQKRTFSEQLPTLVGFRQRRTVRQTTLLQNQAFGLGGEGGARSLHKMGIEISPDTLLRLIKGTPLPQPPTPRVLGVDDWAKQKGRNYGTILVDLETHRVVELLADREAQTLADWLGRHPSVEIISRDRAGAYADGARRGAPQAVQVADRFHLLKNLVDYLKTVFERKRASLTEVRAVEATIQTAEALIPASPPSQVNEVEAATGSSSALPDNLSTKNEWGMEVEAQAKSEATKNSRKQENFEQIKLLSEKGYSRRLIARTLGVSRQTIVKYLKGSGPPRYTPRTKHSKLDPYKAYLLARWQAGVYKREGLVAEIRARGYQGSASLVAFYLAELNQLYPRQIRYRGWADKTANKPTKKLKPVVPRQLISARGAAFLMIKPPADLEEAERGLVDHLRNFDRELDEVYKLSQEFAQMLRQKQAGNLQDWLKRACLCESEELKSFARGIGQDRAAVEAGLTLPWSQGQVEGQVNRLKTIKRTSYGRASFELLRARVLQAA